MRSDEEKAKELLRRRELADKGLKERADGKPVDPLADITSLDPDDKRTEIDPEAVPKRPAGIGTR